MSSSKHAKGPTQAHAKHHTPQASAHMNVLGREGEDLLMSHRPSAKSSPMRHTSAASQQKRTHKGVSDDCVIHGQTAAHTPASGPVTPRRGSRVNSSSGNQNITGGIKSKKSIDEAHHANSPRRPESASLWWGKLWGNTADIQGGDVDETSSQYQSLEAPDSSAARRAFVSSTISNATVTVEDRLKQDCAFFYQGIEETSPAKNRRQGLQPLTSALNQSRLLTSAAGAQFRAKYEQLNQETVLLDTDDLFLDEYTTQHKTEAIESSKTTSTRTSQTTGKLSTLFFEQNGRLLMRLPRDQTRLIMDQDLEPGIISVEQWRKVNRKFFDPVGPSISYDEEDERMAILEDGEILPSRTKQPPALQYVITVPEDLYRRVVAEMSYALMPPWWGFCSESDGRADIKLALGILAVILLLLFISTMEWPTD